MLCSKGSICSWINLHGFVSEKQEDYTWEPTFFVIIIRTFSYFVETNAKFQENILLNEKFKKTKRKFWFEAIKEIEKVNSHCYLENFMLVQILMNYTFC